MISIFRKIRQSMLSDKRFAKYLLYAIGEIVLVVIGILIALQINTWNEENKEREWEAHFLHDLQNELDNDFRQLQNTFDIQQEKGNNCELLLELMHQANPEVKQKMDSLFHALQSINPTFFPTTGVYDSGMSAGRIDNLQNDSLKYMIMNLYNHYYERLVYNGEVLDQVVQRLDWGKREFYSNHTREIISFEASQNRAFQSQIEFLLDQNRVYRRLAQKNLDQMSAIIEALKIETEQLHSN